MKGTTHLLAGAAAASFIAYHYSGSFCFMIVGGMMGGLLPDIDHPKSLGSSFLKNRTLGFFLKHRSFTHSLLGIFLLTLGCFLLQQYISLSFSLGLVIGAISHILLDMLTPGGVQLFFPKKKRYGFPIWSLISWLLEVTVLCFGLAILLMIWKDKFLLLTQ